jgi:hypothetical protein
MMTIQVELSPETESRLAAEAAARRMDIPAYVAALLEHAALEPRSRDVPNGHARSSVRKSLAQLFAESPFRGLNLDFEREPDFGRDMAL